MKNFTLMRSLLIATIAVAFLFSSGYAGNEVKLVPGAQNSLSVNESSYNRLQVTNILNDLNFLEVTTSKGLFTELLIPGY